MIEINLIPDVKQELIRAQMQRSVVIFVCIVAAIAAVGLVVVTLLYVFGVQTVRSGLLDRSITSESTKLANVQDLPKTLTIQNQLSKITDLNAQRKVDSRVFDVLSAVIPPAPNDIQVSNLLLTAEGTQLSIEGQAPSFEALETFKKTLDGAQVVYREGEDEKEVKLATNINVSDVSYGEDTNGVRVLRFTMAFTYPEPLFAPSSSSIIIRLSNQGNVTDSFLGIPRSIFAPRANNTEAN